MWWIFQATIRNHRNTRPPTRATTAPTTATVIVVVLENPVDEPVCVGTGVTGVAVVSRTGLAGTPDADANSVVSPGVVKAALPRVEVVVGVPWAEKNAL